MKATAFFRTHVITILFEIASIAGMVFLVFSFPIRLLAHRRVNKLHSLGLDG